MAFKIKKKKKSAENRVAVSQLADPRTAAPCQRLGLTLIEPVPTSVAMSVMVLTPASDFDSGQVALAPCASVRNVASSSPGMRAFNVNAIWSITKPSPSAARHTKLLLLKVQTRAKHGLCCHATRLTFGSLFCVALQARAALERNKNDQKKSCCSLGGPRQRRHRPDQHGNVPSMRMTWPGAR